MWPVWAELVYYVALVAAGCLLSEYLIRVREDREVEEFFRQWGNWS